MLDSSLVKVLELLVRKIYRLDTSYEVLQFSIKEKFSDIKLTNGVLTLVIKIPTGILVESLNNCSVDYSYFSSVEEADILLDIVRKENNVEVDESKNTHVEIIEDSAEVLEFSKKEESSNLDEEEFKTSKKPKRRKLKGAKKEKES